MGQIITSLRDAYRFVDDLISCKTDFAFDFETSSLDHQTGRPLGISLTFDRDHHAEESCYIAFEHTEPDPEDATLGVPHVFIPLDEATALLGPLFERAGVTAVAHNLQFDIQWLWRLGIVPACDWHDTMLGEFSLDENQPSFGLKQTVARVYGHQMDKFQDLHAYRNYRREEFLAVPLTAAATYAIADTVWTFRLYDRQCERLGAENLLGVFDDLVMPLLPVLARMTWHGITLDIDRVARLRDQFTAESDEIEQKVWHVGMDMLDAWHAQGRDIPPNFLKIVRHLEKEGEQVDEVEGGVVVRGRFLRAIYPTEKSLPRVAWFNPGSRDHLGHLIYGHLGLKVPRQIKIKRNEDGSVGVDKDTLAIIKHFLGEKTPPVLDDLLAWRKQKKIVSTYLEPWLRVADDHGRVHTNFNQHVARTGRLSSSQPINLQNVPARGELGETMRSLFIAGAGRKLVVADYANMEMRFAGHISRDPVIIKAFAEGMDLHALSASAGMGISYEAFMTRYLAGDKECKKYRTVFKTVNFSALYGISPPALQKRILVDSGTFVTLTESTKYLGDFDGNVAVFTGWKEEVGRWTRKLGYVETFARRRRRLPAIYAYDKWDVAEAERQAVSSIIQGSCADIMNMALIEIDRQIRRQGLDAYIVCVVHDEVVVNAADEHAEAVARLVETAMMGVCNDRLRIPMLVAASTADNWRDAK